MKNDQTNASTSTDPAKDNFSGLARFHEMLPTSNPMARRSFLRRMGLGAVTLGPGVALVSAASKAFAESDGITEGDAALLRFAAAAEILETDLWCSTTSSGASRTAKFQAGVGTRLTPPRFRSSTGYGPYIHDNTDDEFTHQNFLKAYLASKGATLSISIGSALCRAAPRRAPAGSYDLQTLCSLLSTRVGGLATAAAPRTPILIPAPFPQAIPGLNKGQFTAIPRTDADLTPPAHIQAIANTATLASDN